MHTRLRVDWFAIGLLTAGGSAALADVTQAWLDRYDGAANFNDYAVAIESDAVGDAVVVGFTFFESEPGYFIPQFLTIKYAPDGTRRWVRVHQAFGVSSIDALAIAPDNSVIVIGAAMDFERWGVIKYDPAGNVVWSRLFVENSFYQEGPTDVAVDSGGNVFVVGRQPDLSDNIRTTLVKYNSSGTQQWVREYQGVAGYSDPLALTTDAAGSAYVAGATAVAGRAVEMSLIKYDAVGTLAWVRTYGLDHPVSIDVARNVLVDHDGNLVVVGSVGGNTIAGADVAVLKYNPSGTLLWSQTWDGPDFRSDDAFHTAVDSQNKIIIACWSANSLGNYDALLLKCDAAGTVLWNARLAGEGNAHEYVAGVRVDPADDIYWSGTFQPLTAFDSYFVEKYTGSGVLEWHQEYLGELDGYSQCAGLALGTDGGVYVSGDSEGIGSGPDVVTIKYAQAPANLPGDVNGDGHVDLSDLALLLSSFGLCSGAPGFLAGADFDATGCVELSDLAVLLARFGE